MDDGVSMMTLVEKGRPAMWKGYDKPSQQSSAKRILADEFNRDIDHNNPNTTFHDICELLGDQGTWRRFEPVDVRDCQPIASHNFKRTLRFPDGINGSYYLIRDRHNRREVVVGRESVVRDRLSFGYVVDKLIRWTFPINGFCWALNCGGFPDIDTGSRRVCYYTLTLDQGGRYKVERTKRLKRDLADHEVLQRWRLEIVG